MKMELSNNVSMGFSKSSMPFDLSVERLKRAHALSARFENLGLPPEIELELERRMSSLDSSNFVVSGNVEISC